MSLTHILFSFLVDAVIKIPKPSMRSWPENRRFPFYLNWMHDWTRGPKVRKYWQWNDMGTFAVIYCLISKHEFSLVLWYISRSEKANQRQEILEISPINYTRHQSKSRWSSFDNPERLAAPRQTLRTVLRWKM